MILLCGLKDKGLFNFIIRRFIMHLTLHLTNNCNMRCSYCNIPKNNIKAMSINTARASVDFVVNSTNENESSGIVFFGSEPLLH